MLEHGDGNGPRTLRRRIVSGVSTQLSGDASVPLAGGDVLERVGLVHVDERLARGAELRSNGSSSDNVLGGPLLVREFAGTILLEVELEGDEDVFAAHPLEGTLETTGVTECFPMFKGVGLLRVGATRDGMVGGFLRKAEVVKVTIEEESWRRRQGPDG